MPSAQLSPWFEEHWLVGEEVPHGFLRTVYGWMAGGLLLSAASASFVAASTAVRGAVLARPLLTVLLLLAEIAVVAALAPRAARLGPLPAAGAFIAYALLNGLTLGGIALAYAGVSLAAAFAAPAVMFGLVSVLGARTRRDLASPPVLAVMAAVGIALVLAVGLALAAGWREMALAILAIAVFALLAGRDGYRLERWPLDRGPLPGASPIAGALVLYLDLLAAAFAPLRRERGKPRG